MDTIGKIAIYGKNPIRIPVIYVIILNIPKKFARFFYLSTISGKFPVTTSVLNHSKERCGYPAFQSTRRLPQFFHKYHETHGGTHDGTIGVIPSLKLTY